MSNIHQVRSEVRRYVQGEIAKGQIRRNQELTRFDIPFEMRKRIVEVYVATNPAAAGEVERYKKKRAENPDSPVIAAKEGQAETDLKNKAFVEVCRYVIRTV